MNDCAIKSVKSSLRVALETQKTNRKRISIDFVTFMILISSTFGVSSMGLSSIAGKSGILLYLFLLACSIAVNYASYDIFNYFIQKYKLKSFSEFSELIMGKRFKFLPDFLFFIFNYGNLIGNCLIINIYIGNIFIMLNYENPILVDKNNTVIIILLLIFTLPIALKKHLKELFIITIITMIIIFYTVSFMIW